eukprot:50906-Pyramimonas_sp.AAC.1
MTCPQAAVDAEAQGWIDLWTSHGAHSRRELPRPWETATSEHSMARPTAKQIRAICKAFPEHTGVGVDNWHPRWFACPGDGGLDFSAAFVAYASRTA